VIHSLDGEALARELDRAAAAVGAAAVCLIEVNLGEETAKGGVSAVRVGDLLERLSSCGHLAIRGLMAIPPPGNHESNRPHFAKLRRLRDRLNDLRLPNVQLKELSMGMSSDFEAAIEEGATMVRIGTAIFGPRGVPE
jgi:PLP dependent protein